MLGKGTRGRCLSRTSYPLFLENAIGVTGFGIVFSKEDALDINPHENDLLVIIIQLDNWDMMRSASARNIS